MKYIFYSLHLLLASLAIAEPNGSFQWETMALPAKVANAFMNGMEKGTPFKLELVELPFQGEKELRDFWVTTKPVFRSLTRSITPVFSTDAGEMTVGIEFDKPSEFVIVRDRILEGQSARVRVGISPTAVTEMIFEGGRGLTFVIVVPPVGFGESIGGLMICPRELPSVVREEDLLRDRLTLIEPRWDLKGIVGTFEARAEVSYRSVTDEASAVLELRRSPNVAPGKGVVDFEKGKSFSVSLDYIPQPGPPQGSFVEPAALGFDLQLRAVAGGIRYTSYREVVWNDAVEYELSSRFKLNKFSARGGKGRCFRFVLGRVLENRYVRSRGE